MSTSKFSAPTSIRLRVSELKEIDRIRKKIDPDMTRSMFLRKLVRDAVESYQRQEEYDRIVR